MKYTALPRVFASHPKARKLRIVLERDLWITNRARLAAKLLIFATRTDMRRFWDDVLGCGDLGAKCDGAVSKLSYQVIDIRPGKRTRSYTLRDRTYFCVVGLCKHALTHETISHEAVHVAYAYVERVRRPLWWWQAKCNEEERLAYPAGRATLAIYMALKDAGLEVRSA